MPKRPNWSAPLRRPITPCHHKPLHILADVRTFILDVVRVEQQGFATWQRTGATSGVTVALQRENRHICCHPWGRTQCRRNSLTQLIWL
jgi:hypothetical protein